MKFSFLTLFAFCLLLHSCDLLDKAKEECENPWNTLCAANCTKTVHLSSAVWNHATGTDVFTIEFTFDKDIDAAASDFANGNGIVVYSRAGHIAVGSIVSGTVTGSGKVWTFTSSALGNAIITDPVNFFEIALENSDDKLQGIRTTDGGVFDANSDCNDLTTEHREVHQF